MKKRLLVLSLALLFTLPSCASMLNRSYSSVTPHVDKPTTAEDPSVLRVENYRELVSAVLYLVSQGAGEGTIQLYDYAGDVASDLASACLEVATQDPLAAYAVDYIRHESTRVVSYYEAKLDIHYRRTMEQVRSMVNVTGTGAIRTELQKALSHFDPEVVLRVAYFSQDEASIAQLIRQVYYDTPAYALGMPEAEINLYPDSGRERVVEILLAYPDRDIRADSGALSHMVERIAETYWALEEEEVVRRAAQALAERVTYDFDGPSNAYDALVEGKADSEGMALTYSLLCGRALDGTGDGCGIVVGSWMDGEGNETPRFWNAVTLSGGRTLYLDPTLGRDALYPAAEFFALGYRWEGGPEEPEEGPLQSKNP